MSQWNEGIKTFNAGEALAVYRLVKQSASETVTYCDADDSPVGSVILAVANGDHAPVKAINYPGTFKLVAAGAFAVGARLRPVDDGKVDDAQAAGGSLFLALEAASADGDIVEVLPLAEATGLLFANLADSAEVENTTTETAFDVSKTIDGTRLLAGDVLEIVARAYVVDQNSTDTLTLRLKVGTEEIVATAAVDVADADIGLIHAFVTVRAAGASGKLAASGHQALGVPGTVACLPFRKDEASEDLSGDVAVTVTAEWSVAHADNEVELENLIVIHHRQ